MYQRVLVPVDLSDMDISQPALDRAVAIVKGSGGELRLLNVLSMIPAAYIDYVPSNYDNLERGRAEEQLKEIAAKTGLPAGKVSSAIHLGAIYHEVLNEAKSWKSDLIVVGSHHPTFATYLIGSNAANIVRHAHCSVLVVR